MKNPPHRDEVERALRDARPRARDELVTGIVDRVSSARTLRAPRLAIAIAASVLTALLFASVGGLDYAAAAAKGAQEAVGKAAKPNPSSKGKDDGNEDVDNDKDNGTSNGKGNGNADDEDAAERSGDGKTTICHATASSSNPYVTITISNSALSAHSNHGDIVPAPAGGCPGKTPGEDQYKPGKGCGDKNHVHFKEGQCKGGGPKR